MTSPFAKIRALVVILVAIGLLLACAGTASAASPAWKLLGVTGPTNLPPEQSETQRVTVEAEGGTFTLAQATAEGEGTFNAHLVFPNVTAGSRIVEVFFTEETLSVGERVFSSAFPAGTTIVGISGPANEPALEMSDPATVTEGFVEVRTGTNQVTGVTTTKGTFHPGDEVVAAALPPGTTVTAVGSGTLTLSDYPTAGGSLPLTGREETAPIPFDASASTVQAQLEALPALPSGSVAVSGGSGGSAATPYYIAFGGRFANADVAELEVSAGGLIGAHAAARVFTVIPGGTGTGKIVVIPANIGGAPTGGEITLRIGPLPPGILSAGPAESAEIPQNSGLPTPGFFWSCPGVAGESIVTCHSSVPFKALRLAQPVSLPLAIHGAEGDRASVPVEIEGGGATLASYAIPVRVSHEEAPAGVQAFWAGAFDEDGLPVTQAGAHPYSAQTFFRLNTVRSAIGKLVPAGDARDVVVDLPPGFVGNPLVTPRCPQALLVGRPASSPGEKEAEACNKEMSVGILIPALAEIDGETAGADQNAIFNDVPAPGQAAEFTSLIAQTLQSLIGSVRGAGDGGVRIIAPRNPNLQKIFGAYAVLFGQPASAKGKAFLDNPTACAQQAEESAQGRGPWTKIEASSWQLPSVFSPMVDPLPLITNCRPLTEAWVGNGPDPANEKPTFRFEPSTTEGSSGAGATATLHVPQEGLTDPAKLVTAHLKKAVVKLPQGLIVNPSSANGLEACSEAQIGLLGTDFPTPAPIRFNEEAPKCPDGSKLGTFELSTPLLEEKIGGTIYLAAQEENPFHSLIALYLVVESPRFGLTLKIAGEVTPDPGKEGQLTATFDNNPQLPFEDLILHFRGGGGRSELATPEVCDQYATTGSLAPWSAEAGEAAEITEPGFKVDRNCSSSMSSRPFAPSIEAGTTEPKAGSYSSMVIKVNRKDGEQELDQLDFTLPLGVVGKLAGIPYCSESAIAAASGKSGKAELSNPSCPAVTQVGTVDTSAGVGSEPIHVGGHVYWAGPYKGAPLSTVVITPAVAGPFDLGTVVVRAPLYLNLETAQITAKSDPVPTQLRGLPLKLRSVAITIDRPNFILNPTNCEPHLFEANLHSSNGGTANPASRFQVGGCKQLKFKPGLKLSLNGATRRSGHPALKAVVTYPKKGAYANIARAQVGLPHSEFLDQGNLDKVCTQPELKSATCPKRAIYGHAKAWTPLLDKPLEGPVYIGVGFGHKLPDLVADLNGQVRILLHGKVDTTKHEGIRNTFEVVPDAPVSRFVLEMKGGKKYGLLENSENICSKPQRASAMLKAQNGLSEHLRPLIANDCKKKATKGKRRKG